jgi:hypothetical protein
MDESTPIITLLIVAITAAVSLRAFTDVRLREKLIFSPGAILADREYYRLASSGLLHADGQHLLFNLVSLFLFGRNLEPLIGGGHLLFIYLWKNPLHLPLKTLFRRSVKTPAPPATSAEVDAILEKISAHGLHGLTEKERRLLKEASRR